MLYYKILKDREVQKISTSEFPGYEINADLLNTVSKIDTGFSPNNLLKDLP